ncbi:MAG: PfkB family carbohydrate kinase [Candidatus Jordarchaeales archaeon]
MGENWPYLLFLPANPYELKTFLLEVFGSPISLEILEKIDRGVQTQKDIIRQLRHSNKTVISHLKNLVRLGVLEKEYKLEEGKYVIWYKPTNVGRWLLLMFKRRLPSTDLEKVLEELLKSYLNNIAELCLKKGMGVERLKEAFSVAVATSLAKFQKASFKPEVVVYGVASVDYLLYSEQTSSTLNLLYDFQETMGGSGGNVAIALSRLNVKVSFAGKIGGDMLGWQIISHLLNEGVDTSNLVIDHKLYTPMTLTIFEKGQKRIYVTATAKTALSLSDPREVNWDLIKNSKAICICEVFKEIGELLASYAKASGVKVFYRPATFLLESGFKNVEGMLRNTDFLVLGEKGWNILSKDAGEISRLFEQGLRCVVVFKGIKKGCTIYIEKGKIDVEGINADVLDGKRAKDAFLAGFIKSILDGNGLAESARFGIATSVAAAQKANLKESMPKLDEVLRIFERG